MNGASDRVRSAIEILIHCTFCGFQVLLVTDHFLFTFPPPRFPQTEKRKDSSGVGEVAAALAIRSLGRSGDCCVETGTDSNALL